MSIEEKLRKLKLLAFDVDGILTDNTVFMGDNGMEFKQFNIADGFGFYLARQSGIVIALISGRYSAATDSRAQELEVNELFQDRYDKAIILSELMSKYNLSRDEICFMGDDLVDLSALDMAGFSVTVPHAPHQLRERVDYITKCEGGNGAVRELIDMILEARGVDVTTMWEK